MSDPTGPFLSVRGDARQTVPPDKVTLPGTIEVSLGSKAAALQAAAASLDRLIADLTGLGGVALGAGAGPRPLTWSAQSATTHAEGRHNEETGRYEQSGQVVATVAVQIAVRDFGMLDRLAAVLAAHEALGLHGAAWQVDWDNPAWPEVRAAAIQSAIRKARSYAAALGGTLQSVEHIADAGLLGGGDSTRVAFTGGARAMSASGGQEPGTPSLDPVPQQLTATIEARFIATGVSLAGR